MIAVTGAGGYLGSRLVRRVAGPVRVLVRVGRPYLGALDQRTVDLTGPIDDIADALRGVEAVVHLAGENEITAARDPDRALADTVSATRRLAAAARDVGVGRVVYASTVHVYGAQLRPGAHIDEATAPAPRSAYAIARLASEHTLGALADEGVEVVVLRLTNVVGPPADVDVDRWTLVTSDLCRQAVTTGRLALRSSGQQYRDFVAAPDVDEILLASLGDTVPAGTYNVASGTPTTIRELAHLVQDRVEALTGTRPALDAPEPEGPPTAPYHVVPDRLHATGLKTSTPLADAVDEIVAFCEARRDDLSRSSDTG